MDNLPKRTGRPPVPPERQRRRIRVYVAPETEAAIKAGIGLKDLGKFLDRKFKRRGL